ncbi:conserved hypothetical protein [Ricinus communis]|uniref:Uncharacterized protein n=1 Tax=Ricinus communis TaxID=3988 RepID=B9T9C6_RICCO|nr:conserved hypothetical protein [Ricinus communis]
MIWSSRATSATLRAIGPGVSRRRLVGRNPTTPHSAAGMRTEPPVSVPTAAGASRAASSAPQPPLLPPAMSSAS